ncbi:hypothetical protein, partial [Allopontixanthobacter sediminis]|uniref:hypothetical protein n=1 Tax=Allopontixanthobacter sediminis TaxID=1689985 RepID=UPI001E4DA175
NAQMHLGQQLVAAKSALVHPDRGGAHQLLISKSSMISSFTASTTNFGSSATKRKLNSLTTWARNSANDARADVLLLQLIDGAA